jgi:hypothetical protein
VQKVDNTACFANSDCFLVRICLHTIVYRVYPKVLTLTQNLPSFMCSSTPDAQPIIITSYLIANHSLLSLIRPPMPLSTSIASLLISPPSTTPPITAFAPFRSAITASTPLTNLSSSSLCRSIPFANCSFSACTVRNSASSCACVVAR